MSLILKLRIINENEENLEANVKRYKDILTNMTNEELIHEFEFIIIQRDHQGLNNITNNDNMIKCIKDELMSRLYK